MRYWICGKTFNGRMFRPSDWAERLAGVLAEFRPGRGEHRVPGSLLGYSPYAIPLLLEGVKGVLVDPAIGQVEPQAWEFVRNFARDNGLPMLGYPLAQPLDDLLAEGPTGAGVIDSEPAA